MKQKLIALILISILTLSGCGTSSSSLNESEDSKTDAGIEETTEDQQQPSSEAQNEVIIETEKIEDTETPSIISSGSYDIIGEDFKFSDNVRNDVTGNWRISLIASSKDPTEYALDYYNTLFSSDDEIHAVVNFTLNTTTKISVLYEGMLDVTVLEYVDGEEHDANLLFSGNLLKEYWINTETGEVEEIQ